MDVPRRARIRTQAAISLLFLALTAVTFLCLRPQENIANNGEQLPASYGLQNRLRRQLRQAKDECGSNEAVTSEVAVLTSPGFPDHYRSNEDCRWLLSAPEEGNIALKITSLDLEQDKDCKLDYLQVYLGNTTHAPSLGPFCGVMKDMVIVTNVTTVLVVFHTDPSYEDKGFSLEYYLQSLADCQGTLTKGSGTVNSPQFPANYPDNADCWTLISVAENRSILFQFESLDLEFGENCTYDYLEIFDGISRAANSLGRFCSSKQKAPIQSSGNALLLHFHSDHLVNRQGFRAHYTTVSSVADTDVRYIGGCLWESESKNGTIASPNYPQKYPSNAHCRILITAPPKEVITIVFDSLQLEVEVNCSYDYLQIKEGFNIDSKIIGTYCGRLGDPKNITTSQNILLITFQSDDFAEFSGFKARYWFHSRSDDTIVDDPSDSAKEKKIPASNDSRKKGIAFLEVPQNATLPLGASYLLPCAVNDPGAKIRWLKNEQFLGGNTPLPGLKLLANNTLWIQSMSKDLIGMYTCAAVTPEKTLYVKAWLTMENYFAANDANCNIVLRKTPRDSAFSEGEFAHLECLAAGTDVKLQWEKDGLPLESKGHITVLRNGFLFIDAVSLQDAGAYTCIITDLESNCLKRVSAILRVNEKANVQQICGRPLVGEPSKDKPRLDHGKIVGGHDVNKGAYPWQVMLWDPMLKTFCGGSLINERWIVTAAHCFVSYKYLRWDEVVIKLGKFNRETNEDEEFQTGIAEPSAIVLHPAYDKDTFDNDVALVRLKDHVKFTNHILPICLGERELTESIFSNPELQMGTVTGWGKLKEKGPSPKHLQEIRLPLVNQKTCVASTTYMVSRNMFCAGYSQEILGDACHGDSGGPFVVNYEAKWYLLGVVSWGEGCGKRNKYGFYTRITNYIPWIKGIMKS